MKNIAIFILMAASLFANEECCKENTFNIQHVVGQFIILSNETVFKTTEANPLGWSDLGRALEIKNQEGHSFLVDPETPLKVSCVKVGEAKDPFTNVSHIFSQKDEERDMVIELYDGDLYIVPEGATTVWSLGAPVLKVETESGVHILDFYDGSFDFVCRFGTVNPESLSDTIESIHKDTLILESLGQMNAAPSIFGNFKDWNKGDEIAIQIFTQMHFSVSEENASYFFLYNVTQDKLAIGFCKK